MAPLSILAGLVLVGLVLRDIFHTMVLPRTLASRFRVTTAFYQWSWPTARQFATRLLHGRLREISLATFGPLSLILLISVWAVTLIVGFALIDFGLEPHGRSFAQALYFSGSTFFTLGIGDEKPVSAAGRVLTVLEAGVGFGTLAIVIGYLPVLYQAFSRRELEIAILASRAGFPATATGLLTRMGKHPDEGRILNALQNYERWCAEIMENHSSYPMLAFYRSQHDKQSWLGTLTMLLDACAVLQVGFENHPEWREAVEDQAELTFSMGCRALVTLAGHLRLECSDHYPDRLRVRELRTLQRTLSEARLELRMEEGCLTRLVELRALYEPYAFAVGRHLILDVPPFVLDRDMIEPTTPEAAIKDAVEVL